MIRFLTILFCLFVYTFPLNAQNVKKTNTPTWVTKTIINKSTRDKEEGAFNYLLIDLQDNLINEEQYVHYAIKILNGDGVQELSDISASYDPAFQTLEFHAVNIIRNDVKIEKLSSSIINNYQRETNLERSLYDGSLTSVINLTDVREGDIIEYAYTIKGFNPVNEGNYSNVFYQQYTLPVDRIYTRLVTNSENNIEFKTLNGASEPKVVKTPLSNEYIWDNSGLNNLVYDTNVPYWYDIQSKVSISTFSNWRQVGDLLNPLYGIEDKSLKAPIKINKSIDSEEEIILKLIRFVQDEVRYLGFEAGIGAYTPSKPSSVLARRYGDCKDKSLLLSNLLQNQGVSAYPLLVNTRPTKDMYELLPSHYLFNHCIVLLKYGGQEYFIDPTISNQGGSLSRISTPDYKFGFVLNANSNKLITIPNPTKPSLRIVEDIILDTIGGSASFTVQSEYTGNKADYMRSYFQNNTEESVNIEYLNFYSSLYPGISSSNKVSFLDNSRPWENIVTTNEEYIVENLWLNSESAEGIYFDTYSIVLDGLLNYSKSAKREMPYYTGAPFNFEQVTRITLPEPWNVKKQEVIIDGEGFSYKKGIDNVGNIISISHRYELTEETIKGEEVGSFLSKHDKIREQLGFQLTYNNSETNATNISWLSISLALISLAVGITLAILLNKNYDPIPKGKGKMAIGGWLVLPAIGLVLTPFVLIFQLFSDDYFNKAIWEGFELAGYKNANVLNLYLGFELIYNILLFIFSILLIILFFKKRTSLPKLMIFFYAINLAVIILGSFVLNQSGIDDPTFEKDLFRGIISAAIWIPYFLVSNRVKNTFVVEKNPENSRTNLNSINLES